MSDLTDPLYDEIAALREENIDLNKLFDLQYTRMGEAVAVWRAHNPGNERVVPDLGNLLTWMLGYIRELQVALAEALGDK